MRNYLAYFDLSKPTPRTRHADVVAFLARAAQERAKWEAAKAKLGRSK